MKQIVVGGYLSCLSVAKYVDNTCWNCLIETICISSSSMKEMPLNDSCFPLLSAVSSIQQSVYLHVVHGIGYSPCFIPLHQELRLKYYFFLTSFAHLNLCFWLIEMRISNTDLMEKSGKMFGIFFLKSSHTTSDMKETYPVDGLSGSGSFWTGF